VNLIEKHIRKTEKLLRAIEKSKIADWLLNEGIRKNSMPCFGCN
jgi:hypothetical protein